jgi:hypothetical protein
MTQSKNNRRFSAVRALLVAAATLSASVAMAVEPAVPAKSDSGKDHPCRTLRKAAIEACSSAKFEKGKSKEHKGLFKDCVRPIMDGKAVEGVVIDAAIVKGCQERKAAKGKASM